MYDLGDTTLYLNLCRPFSLTACKMLGVEEQYLLATLILTSASSLKKISPYTIALISRDRSKNSKPTQRGQYHSIEVIGVVHP